MSNFLKNSELTETRAFVHSFVKEIEVKPGKAAIVYSIPTPEDSPIGERTPRGSLKRRSSQYSTVWWASLMVSSIVFQMWLVRLLTCAILAL